MKGEVAAGIDLDIVVVPGLKVIERHKVACMLEEALGRGLGDKALVLELHVVPEWLLEWYGRHVLRLVD